jgi:hypothetical protein
MRISDPNVLECGVNTRFPTQFPTNTELKQVSKIVRAKHLIW